MEASKEDAIKAQKRVIKWCKYMPEILCLSGAGDIISKEMRKVGEEAIMKHYFNKKRVK